MMRESIIELTLNAILLEVGFDVSVIMDVVGRCVNDHVFRTARANLLFLAIGISTSLPAVMKVAELIDYHDDVRHEVPASVGGGRVCGVCICHYTLYVASWASFSKS